MEEIQTSKEILSQVESALDTMRPYLQRDGGDVEVVEITEDMTVRVKLLGACENCPQSYMTMKAGIEEAIKNAVPGIQAVVSVNS